MAIIPLGRTGPAEETGRRTPDTAPQLAGLLHPVEIVHDSGGSSSSVEDSLGAHPPSGVLFSTVRRTSNSARLADMRLASPSGARRSFGAFLPLKAGLNHNDELRRR